MDRSLAARIDAIRDRAASLAAAIAPATQASTTVGVERATLRLVGVQGLDRAGVPLAASIVERAIGEDPARLARGILLPFAAAVVLYEASPADLALDVADGSIDLDLEAEALADPARRGQIEEVAGDLVRAALARVEANRTARSELLDMLGDTARPLVGIPLRSRLVDPARQEAALLVAGGADLLQVEVPASRELAERLGDPAEDDRNADPLAIARGRRTVDEVAPTGSQRALTEVRELVDRAAAERRAYVRIAAAAQPLGGPELAVVAAFERVDVVDADPIDEIIAGGVDPARALADHAFVRKLTSRAGGMIRVTDGPLVVGPDLARGTPSAARVRAGRALALQAISVGLGRCVGLADADMLLGSLPAWILDERDATSTALAFLMVQHGLHPDLPLAIREPVAAGAARSRWAVLRAVTAMVGGRTALIMREADVDSVAMVVADTRSVAETGAALADAIDRLSSSRAMRETVGQVADAAAATLDDFAARGWDAVVGPVDVAGDWAGRLAAGTCARRADAPEVIAMGARAGS